MKILKESVINLAWMISRTGTAYSVFMHPYGHRDDDAIEDTMWLLCIGFVDESKGIDYISKQFLYDYGVQSVEDMNDEFFVDVSDTLEEIGCLTGYAEKNLIIRKVIQYLRSLSDEEIEKVNVQDVRNQCKFFKDLLNNSFLRARYGDEYQTHVTSPGALYFRISSEGFDWYPVILQFCIELSDKKKISSITVETDASSTGRRIVYKDHVSWNDFLEDNKPAVLESERR